MRRVGLLLILVALLVAAVVLSRLVATWHYILPAEPGAVVYAAAFDGLTDDWEQYEGRVSAEILPESVLRLDVGSAPGGPFSVARPYFGDFDVRVEAQAVSGPINNGYGLIFRLQNHENSTLGDDRYYLFEVSSDGYYRVQRVLGSEQKDLSTWIPSPVINEGLDTPNYLRVVAQGDQFAFYVNGQQMMLCIPDDPEGESTFDVFGNCTGGTMQPTLTDDALAYGQLGVIARALDAPDVVVEFDNFIVYGPTAVE
ncbi:MAG: hypothetical protein H6672_06190 [Anaerolineaceae bacterium]|nr:hypothetical protein [Anaerolineaceae bacterium]